MRISSSRSAIGLLVLIAFAAHARATRAAEEKKAQPIRALLVTGGCCHDYENQKQILTAGISARANVVWTVAHQGGSSRTAMIELYKSPDWADAYDVVLHNECFGGVTDVAFVERIALAHYEGKPAVTIHCSTHSYRNAKTDQWRAVLGVSSFSHEKHRALAVKNLATDHPVMQGFPQVWNTPNGELYKIDKIWPSCTPLASAYGEDTKKTHVCVWTNTYGKGRIFGTTIGHHNETMTAPVFLDLVARGLLWSCGKLTDAGKPKPGYEGKGVTEEPPPHKNPARAPTPIDS